MAQVVGQVDALLHVGEELNHGQLYLGGDLRLARGVMQGAGGRVEVLLGRGGEGGQGGRLACLEVA